MPDNAVGRDAEQAAWAVTSLNGEGYSLAGIVMIETVRAPSDASELTSSIMT